MFSEAEYDSSYYLTLGGVTGALGKVTGAMGDVAAKLSFNTDFQEDRKKGTNTFGEGAEGAAKVWLMWSNFDSLFFCLAFVFVLLYKKYIYIKLVGNVCFFVMI